MSLSYIKPGKAPGASRSDVMIVGGMEVTPKFAAINVSASIGSYTIVNAVAGKKIRVVNMFIVAAATVGTRWEDDDGKVKTGRTDIPSYGGYALPFSPVGHFETSANAALTLVIDAAVSCGGSVTYIEV